MVFPGFAAGGSPFYPRQEIEEFFIYSPPQYLFPQKLRLDGDDHRLKTGVDELLHELFLVAAPQGQVRREGGLPAYLFVPLTVRQEVDVPEDPALDALPFKIVKHLDKYNLVGLAGGGLLYDG